ncbi:MAG: 3-oxoacyl-ACP synthase III family protein [Flavobacteriales bacterium]
MKIAKVTHFFPPKAIAINRLSFNNESDYQYHQRLVGTQQLYASEVGTTGSDLALEAAKKMLLSVAADSIDFLLFSSLTLDYKAPSTASVLHHNLSLKASCGVLDIPAGCSAFPSALAIAQGLFLLGNTSRVLILLGEVPSQAVDQNDASLRFLFGDAGVAVLVEPSDSNQHFIHGNDGEGIAYLNVKHGGARFPFTHDYLEMNRHQPQLNRFGRIEMEGHGILKMTLKNIPLALKELLLKYQYQLEDIDYFIFHQGSQVLLEALCKKMKIPADKVLNYLPVFGNTVSCSIPLAWHLAEMDGRFTSGDKIVCLGFGVGFSWSGTIMHYP